MTETKEFPPMMQVPQAYQWMRGDAHMVGTILLVEGEKIYNGMDIRQIAMKLSHTGEEVWAIQSELRKYPSSPIPSP